MEKVYFRHDDLRDQQNELLKDIKRAIDQERNIVAHAPTGLGKTDAVLSPVVTKAIEENKNIFFVTPKISQHKIALEVIKDLNKEHGLSVKAADIVGKKYMCTDKSLREAPSNEFYELCRKQKKEEKCPFYKYAKGYSMKQKKKAQNRIKEFLDWYGQGKTNEQVLNHIEDMDKPLCGYEALIEAGKKAQVVICDYFHVLNPYISQTFLTKINKEVEDSILIIDEAHNAPSRIRDSLSRQIGSYSLKKAKKECSLLNNKDLKNEISRIKRKVEKRGGDIEEKEELIQKNTIPIPSKSSLIDLEETGKAYLDRTGRNTSSCLSLKNFYEEWKKDKEAYIRIIKEWKSGKGYSIQYKCLDPSIYTEDIVNPTSSTIMMSGTLKPQQMYRDLLGLDKGETELKEYKSPFPYDNRINLVVPSVTTKYSKRDKEQYSRIAEESSKIIDETPGNSAIFFPSYSVMNSVIPTLKKKTDKPILVQNQDSTPKERNSLLSRFKNYSRKLGGGAVLAGVSGGSYGEGIDLPGQELMGVIIVGVPLRKPDLETKALIDYFDHKYGKGWEYGYIYPAMTKAIQAAGRCIRNEEDKGVIAYLDNRFTWKNYSRCFPEEINPEITENPGEKVKEFWN